MATSKVVLQRNMECSSIGLDAVHLGINDHGAERIVTPQFAVVFIGLA